MINDYTIQDGVIMKWTHRMQLMRKVASFSNATAGGVIQALGAQGLAGKVPVAGQDAELSAAQRIVEGTQTMTVYKPIQALTEEAAKLAVSLAKGEDVGVYQKVNNGKIEVPSVLLSPIAVNQFNIDDTIIADGILEKMFIKTLENK